MTLKSLWPVTQQFQAKNGSNLVSGKIYIYYQGRTALATTYHDEDGKVVSSNPVLLDNNGRATVFADTAYSYTIVVCDYYGKELFSQDITLHDVTESADEITLIGSDGSIHIDTSSSNGVKTFDMSANTDILATKKSVDDLDVRVKKNEDDIKVISGNVENIATEMSGKKDRQTELTFNGSATKTVKKITQNVNGELNVEFADIDLPSQVPNVEITSEDKSIKVSETTDVQTNTKKFDLSVQDGGTTYSAGDAIDLTNNTISTKYGKGLEITTDNKLQLKVGKGLTLDNDTLELTIKDLAASITSFRTGDVIAVDGPDGIAKMSKDDLLNETAENASKQTALSFIKMEQGGINNYGSLVSNSIRIRSADYIAGNLKLVAPPGFRFIAIFYYDENTLSFSYSVDINKEANIGSAGYVAKFTMAKTDTNQNITPEEVQIYNDKFALNDKLNDVKTETENLRKDDYSISTALVWNEGFVNWHNGNVVASSDFSHCDKVAIDSFVYNKLTVYAKASDEGNAGIAFYDENEVFLYGEPHFGGTATSVQMSQHTIPQHAKYFSFSTKTDAVATSRYILDGSIEEVIEGAVDYNANPFESQFVPYGIDSKGNYYENNNFWALKDPIPQNVDGFWIADDYKATIVKTNKNSGVVTRDVWKTSDDGYYKLNHDVYTYRVYVSKISEVRNSTYSGVYALIFKRVGCVAVREDIDELHEADRYYHTLAKCAIKRKYEIGFANSDDYLHLETYDGSGQFVHPKVLYNDAGIFGHKYWMAYTPYPNADVSKENPCVAYSDDGVKWTNISANPLDLPDDNGTKNYNSDTHLVYREDTKTLECWYRNADSTNQVEKIYRRTTTDGINWSARELLKQTNGLTNLLSPAIIYDVDNHKYKIWVVCASGGYHLNYYESTSGGSWSFIKELHYTFEYNSETYTLWHVDVAWIDNRYQVLCMCDDASGVGMLFYTSSYNNENYGTPVPIMVGRAGRWDLRLYRSCLVKCGNMYRIYYSGVNKVTGTREYRVGISESDELGKFVGFVID